MAPDAKKPAAGAKKTVKRRPAKRKATATSGSAELVREMPPEEVSVLPSASAIRATIATRTTKGVRNKDITAFLRQLIMLLEAGTPLLKSLNSLSQRGERPGIRTMIAGIREYVESGNPLWQAFAREDKYFQPVFVNLVKASEASGTLTTVLGRLVAYRERRALLHKRIQGAMIYPGILVVACLSVVVIIAKVVLPQFKDVFDRFGAELSAFTVGIMGVAEFIASYWWLAILLSIALVAFYKGWFIQHPLRRMAADRFKLRIPLLGPILQKNAVVEFTRTFALLLRSGLSMMATLDLVRNAMSNRAYVEALQDMRDSVERGEGLEKPLRDAERQHLLPGVVVDMLVTGEESGTLDNIAQQIADTYDEEVKIAAESIGEVLVPVVTVFMGGIVVLVALALFLPIIGMLTTI